MQKTRLYRLQTFGSSQQQENKNILWKNIRPTVRVLSSQHSGIWKKWCKRLFPLKEAPAEAERSCGETSAGGCLERVGGRASGGENREEEETRRENV